MGTSSSPPSVVAMDTDLDTHLEMDARTALAAAGLLDRFQALEPGHRSEHSRWIAAATMPEARQYRIEELCEQLDPAAGPVTLIPHPTD